MGFDEPVFMGVYSKTNKFGTRQKVRGFNRWHAWGLDDGSFMVQQVNTLGEAQEEPVVIAPEDFFKNYRVSVSLSAKQEAVPPNYKRPEPRRKVARSGRGRASRNHDIYNLQDYQVVGREEPARGDSAVLEKPVRAAPALRLPVVSFKNEDEQEYKVKSIDPALPAPFAVRTGSQLAEHEKKLRKDCRNAEQRLRSEFSRALLQLRTSRSTAIRDLHELVESAAESLQKEHKYLFTEFGTTLRRRQLFALACRYHEKARQLAPDDEHVLFNLARTLYDSGDVDRARERLEEALNLAPGFKAGWDFLAFLNYGRTVDK